MKVRVVVPSEDHKQSAGVRIRYGRLAEGMQLAGNSLSVLTVEECAADLADRFDACILSKVYTAAALLLARRLRDDGELVGIDLFDNTFTQAGDSRLVPFRQWMTEAHGLLDFAVCSTPSIAASARRSMPDLPAMVIPDPSPPCDPRQVQKLAQAKLERVLATRTLEVLWFGIGSNPFFPVGLSDLAGYASELAALRRNGWTLDLTVLTDRRSLSPDALAVLARLPGGCRVEEWSVDQEEQRLKSSFLCFIPVNAQPFSRVKSLNRPVSALSAGCQVLSPGYHLYRALGPLLYRDAAGLLRDLEAGTAKLSQASVPALSTALSAHANPFEGADRLHAFLAARRDARATERIAPAAAQPAQPRRSRFSAARFLKTGRYLDLGLLHGADHDPRAHGVAASLGVLTAKGPFTRAKVGYDVRFDVLDGTGAVQVSLRDGLLDAVDDSLRPLLTSVDVKGKRSWVLDPGFVEERFPFPGLLRSPVASPVREWCAYGPAMDAALGVCRALFPDVRFMVSELGAWQRPPLRGAA